MESFSLEWAAAAMGGAILGEPTGTVTGVCTDSRQAGPGMLFFALKGEKTDGHNYVAQALAVGACAVVERAIQTQPIQSLDPDLDPSPNQSPNKASVPIQRAQGVQIVVPATLHALGDLARAYRQMFAIPIVGVTGSVGKTSTKEMIASILRTTYNTLASEKNFNNEIGVPLTLFRLEKSHEVAVIEMGMRGLGQIDYLASIALPTIALITKIGTAHIELLGSVANIARAKSEIFNYLPEDGIAILNGRDLHQVVDEIAENSQKIWRAEPGENLNAYETRTRNERFEIFKAGIQEKGSSAYFEEMISRTKLKDRVPEGRSLLTFSASGQAQSEECPVYTKPRFSSVDDQGRVSFRAHIGEEWHTVNLKAVGLHHIDNALAALTVGYALNIPTEKAIAALANWEGAEGRMVVRHTPTSVTLLDDCYNASPESMQGALETLVKLASATGHKGVAVLGDMRELGDYAHIHHIAVGKACYVHAFRLIVVGELAGWIADEVEQLRGDKTSPDYTPIHRFQNAEEAAMQIRDMVEPGDTVLIKGSRAMGMEVIVHALMTPPNDPIDLKEVSHA